MKVNRSIRIDSAGFNLAVAKPDRTATNKRTDYVDDAER